MSKIVYDGTDAVFGRLASLVAKDLLKGNDVDVLNCEKIIVSGDKKLLAKKILAKKEMGSGGSLKGPKYPRVADRLVKRMIRGILPWDRMKGRDAYRKFRAYASRVGSRESVVEVIILNHKQPLRSASMADLFRFLR